jgi:hypothetical protein
MNDRKAKGRAIGPKGEKNGRSKLTENQVVEIRAMGGVASARKIAAFFGVNHWTVADIIKRRTWRYLE